MADDGTENLTDEEKLRQKHRKEKKDLQGNESFAMWNNLGDRKLSRGFKFCVDYGTIHGLNPGSLQSPTASDTGSCIPHLWFYIYGVEVLVVLKC